MASDVYNKGKYEILSGGVDLLTDTIKVMLVDSTYTYADTHNFISDVVADEVSGTGYTGGYGGAGRKTLSNKQVTEDDTNNRAEFDDTADLTWSSVSIGTVGGAILVEERTSDSDSPVVAFLDFSPDAVTNGGDLTIQWDAEGIIQLT